MTTDLAGVLFLVGSLIAFLARGWGAAGEGKPGGVGTDGAYRAAFKLGPAAGIAFGCVGAALLLAGHC